MPDNQGVRATDEEPLLKLRKLIRRGTLIVGAGIILSAQKVSEGESRLPNQCGVLGSQVDRVQKPGLASAVNRVERAVYEHQGVRLIVDCPRNLGTLSDDSVCEVNRQQTNIA